MKRMVQVKGSAPAQVGDRIHYEFRDGQRTWGTVETVYPAREGGDGYMITWRSRGGSRYYMNPALTSRPHAFYRMEA